MYAINVHVSNANNFDIDDDDFLLIYNIMFRKLDYRYVINILLIILRYIDNRQDDLFMFIQNT